MRRAASMWVLIAVVGCADDAAVPAAAPLRGDLDLEIRDTASLVIEPTGAVKLTVTSGFGLLEANKELSSSGRIERLPESSATLYTARFDVPMQSGGPCADKPISLAMSLHRQDTSSRAIGGLTAYCGADTWYGVPARILRLSGPLH